MAGALLTSTSLPCSALSVKPFIDLRIDASAPAPLTDPEKQGLKAPGVAHLWSGPAPRNENLGTRGVCIRAIASAHSPYPLHQRVLGLVWNRRKEEWVRAPCKQKDVDLCTPRDWILSQSQPRPQGHKTQLCRTPSPLHPPRSCACWTPSTCPGLVHAGPSCTHPGPMRAGPPSTCPGPVCAGPPPPVQVLCMLDPLHLPRYCACWALHHLPGS